MAKKQDTYEVKGCPQKITATSRCAVKIKDNYYTIEASEERVFPQGGMIDLDEEYKALFDSVNGVVDGQMNEILDTFGN